MRLQNLFYAIKDWGVTKGILGPQGKGTIQGQWAKVVEEIEETAEAIQNYQQGAGTIGAIQDGIGDSIITLILLAELFGTTAEECLRLAYLEIKDRTGTMQDGTFVKDKNLTAQEQ